MDKALAVVKGEKRKAADVFTIEEETVINEGSSLESDGFDKFELDLDTRSSLEKTIEKTMDDLFKPIKLILEGKVPLDAEELSNDMNEDDDSFVGNAEERLWQSFDNLKEVITNMEFPVELLQQIANRRKTNVEDEKLLNDKSEPLEELVADNNDVKTTHFKMPLSKLNETIDTEELIKHVPSPF